MARQQNEGHRSTAGSGGVVARQATKEEEIVIWQLAADAGSDGTITWTVRFQTPQDSEIRSLLAELMRGGGSSESELVLSSDSLRPLKVKARLGKA